MCLAEPQFVAQVGTVRLLSSMMCQSSSIMVGSIEEVSTKTDGGEAKIFAGRALLLVFLAGISNIS